MLQGNFQWTWLIYWFLVLGLVAYPSNLRAGNNNLTVAERALSDAHNRYFEALYDQSPKTHSEVQQIREQTVTPAIDEVMRVIDHTNSTYVKKYLNVVTPEKFRQEMNRSEKETENWSSKNESVFGFVDFARKFFGNTYSDRALAGLPGSENIDTSNLPAPKNLNKKSSVTSKPGLTGGRAPKVLVFPGAKQKKEETLEELLKK